MRTIFRVVGYAVLFPLFVISWPLYLLWYILLKKDHMPDYDGVELLGMGIVTLVVSIGNLLLLLHLYFITIN